MEIVDFTALPPARHTDAARILREALAHLPSAYNAPGEAEAEVALRCADRDWLGHAALEGERLIGWIGAIRTYRHGWEIHPLVVAPDRQRRGIGSALLADLIERARALGYHTVIAGADGEQIASVALHRKFGFEPCAHLKQVGYKFDRWLDVIFLQLIL